MYQGSNSSEELTYEYQVRTSTSFKFKFKLVESSSQLNLVKEWRCGDNLSWSQINGLSASPLKKVNVTMHAGIYTPWADCPKQTPPSRHSPPGQTPLPGQRQTLPWSEADTPWSEEEPPGLTLPTGQTPTPLGRHASYWNAFFCLAKWIRPKYFWQKLG